MEKDLEKAFADYKAALTRALKSEAAMNASVKESEEAKRGVGEAKKIFNAALDAWVGSQNAKAVKQ